MWLDIVDDDPWWTNYITGFYWGSVESPTLYKIAKAKASTDSGTSCIVGPTEYLNWIISHLVSMLSTYTMHSKWGFVFQCAEKYLMPSFYLLVGDHWFEVRADDYIVQITASGLCAFCLNGSDNLDGYWVLGVTFMRHYYNIHDHTNKRFGFAALRDSPKSNPVPVGEIPQASIHNSSNDGDIEEISNSKNIIYYILLAGAAIIGLGVGLYFCLRNRNKK